MKIAVISSNGRVAKKIIDIAQDRKLQVTGFSSNENKSNVKHFVRKNIFELQKSDLEGFDVVVDAFGVWDVNKMDQHITSLRHLCDLLSGTRTRLIVVGGAGSLYLDKTHTTTVMDDPEFPKEYMPVASNMKIALDELRQRNDVKWTYISPAAEFDPNGITTGHYKLGGEELILNSHGKSYISYGDYATALVDEIQNQNYNQQRISVVSK